MGGRLTLLRATPNSTKRRISIVSSSKCNWSVTVLTPQARDTRTRAAAMRQHEFTIAKSL
jgi:hypothetical protein